MRGAFTGVTTVRLTLLTTGITVSYRRFPALREVQAAREAARQDRSRDTQHSPAADHTRSTPLAKALVKTAYARLKETVLDWREFAQYPIFLSSLAISWLYLTVLSFDGTMLSYLKSHAYSDPFLAGMRGLNVVAGLAGTLAMPFLEKKLGLVRAGNWSIWYVLKSDFLGATCSAMIQQVRGHLLTSSADSALYRGSVGRHASTCLECHSTLRRYVQLCSKPRHL